MTIIVEDEIGYAGTDGLYFQFDETRGKNLSVSRQNYVFNIDANLENFWMRAGGVALSAGETGYVIPRAATITNITTSCLEVNNEYSEIRLTRNDITPVDEATTLIGLEFPQTADLAVPTTVSGELNIDLEASDYLQAKGWQLTTSGSIQNATVLVEVSWRDE